MHSLVSEFSDTLFKVKVSFASRTTNHLGGFVLSQPEREGNAECPLSEATVRICPLLEVMLPS